MPPTPPARPLRFGLARVGRFGQLHVSVLADLNDAVEALRIAEALITTGRLGKVVLLMG